MRWASHSLDQRDGRGCGARRLADVGDDAEGGVDDRLITLVEHEEGARRAVTTVAACRLGAVVQTEHGGRRPALQDAPADLDPLGERREVVGRPTLTGGPWVGPQPHPRDDAERALRPDEQLGEVRPDGGGRRPARAHDGAVGQHDLETGDEVLDLAVAGGVLTRAAAGDPAADGGDLEALRVVPDAHPVVLLELVLEIRAERAGEHLDDARGRVDVADARPDR